MTTYTVYTGTFTKRNGQSRTMNFIRGRDVPSSLMTSTNTHTNSSRTRLAEGSEVVYDIDKKDFRVFNWKSKVGEVSTKNMKYSFDKTK